MGARQKLNRAALNGALVVGTVLGLIGQSWTVFLVATALVALLGLLAGDIRPTKRGR